MIGPLLRRAAVVTAVATLAPVVATSLSAPAVATDRTRSAGDSADRAGPAHRVVRDRGGPEDSRVRDDGVSYGELRALRVGWTGGRLVARFVTSADSGAADFYDLYADTDRDGSPDVRVRWDRTRDARFARAHRTDGYGPRVDPDGIVCARVPRRLVGGDRTSVGQTVVLVVPASCLGRPESVRVSGVTATLAGRADWAPAAQRLSGPVARRQDGD